METHFLMFILDYHHVFFPQKGEGFLPPQTFPKENLCWNIEVTLSLGMGNWARRQCTSLTSNGMGSIGGTSF